MRSCSESEEYTVEFYEEAKNVSEYVKMAEGYDGRELIAILKQYLPPNSSVLELGMGPGTDLDLLQQTYKAIGSDLSSIFLDLYREKHPNAELLKIDASNFKLDRFFDCIYSNKVLYHLSRDALRLSFTQQRKHLSDGGLLMHSFWYGDGEESEQGLRFVYYTEETLMHLVGPGFEVVKTCRYTEMEDADSFYVLLRKNPDA
jgi:cyclopropane fatty-acyl-phospholipid synthase-like methyltransferase